MAMIVLSMPFQSTYHQVDAAVASKAASLTAKKIAKEFIEDAAANQAANFAVQQATDIIMGYQAKPGYKVICPSGASACTNPIQIKETLTDADRTAIKTQAGVELDKALSGGTGSAKWAKFMDWFLPIWLVGFAFTALTYALDPDVKSLFNEVGYNTLVALGIIAPVLDTTKKPATDSPEVDEKLDAAAADPTAVNENMKITTQPRTYTSFWQAPLVGVNLPMKDMVIETRINPFLADTVEPMMGRSVDLDLNAYSQDGEIQIESGSVEFDNTIFTTQIEATVAVNGEVIQTQTVEEKVTNRYYVPSTHAMKSLTSEKLTAVRMRMPYEINGFWYTDVLYFTVLGDAIQYQLKSSENIAIQTATDIKLRVNNDGNSRTSSAMQIVMLNETSGQEILPPLYPEIEQNVDFSAASSYSDEEGNIALIPPTAITYQEETTGETVYRVPNATGDGSQFQKEDGTIVPEENVIPSPEEPQITPSPDGVPQITPAPTPSNPAPQPIPLQPNPTTPPTDPPATEPPLEPFPEGQSCQEQLKFPIFSPLKEQLSTSFPFSIPWDIERAAQAAFGGISAEKPSFVMPIVMFGETQEVTITTPKFMDDWKPFTDSLLLITFDILIMFGLYRFVKGAGS